ncbi:restriction endonuclease subunit S [Pseudomonas sp. V1]|nr:restriction endonuclease subunit S [Pseudomonas arcuscaelestis]
MVVNPSTYFDDNGTVPFIRGADIGRGSISVENVKRISEAGNALNSKSILREGDLVSMRVGYPGVSAVVTKELDGSNCASLLIIRKPADMSSDFLCSQINADFGQGQIKLLQQGAAQEQINVSDIVNFFAVCPPLDESSKIDEFLAHETAKIDTLIEKQQQLIQLLKEKRQAVISHAVTKGLSSLSGGPNAKLRDSGVEWLGEVPEHWVVAQLKFNTLEMQTGPFGSQLHAEDYVDDGIPLVNPAHMTDGKIVPDSKVSVDQETWARLRRHQLFEGDLIFARRGELGRCAVVTKGEEGWLCGTGSLKAKLNERLIPDYSYLLITSDGVVSELSLESKGSTMDNLNTETLGRVRLPVPPVGEQREILDYVESISGKYGLLIDKASSAVELIKERRTALISAAFTGKIDVRDWVAPPASPTHKEVAA